MADKRKPEEKRLASENSEKARTPKYTLRSTEDTSFANKKYTFKKNAPMGNAASLTENVQERRSPLFSSGETDTVKKQKKQRTVQSIQQKKESNEKLRKKAAYIKESMQESISSSYRESYDEATDGMSAKYDETLTAAENTSSGKAAEERAENWQTETVQCISEQTAQRMKRAAYIKEMTELGITADRIASYEEQEENTDSKKIFADDTKLSGGSLSDEKGGGYESRYLGNSPLAKENRYDDKRKNAAVKNAYEKEILKTQAKRRKNAAEMNYDLEKNAALISAKRAKEAADIAEKAENGIRENVMSAFDYASESIDALKSGNAARVIAQPAEYILRDGLSDETNKLTDDISVIASSVKNSDSVGGAVNNTVLALAASEMKNTAREAYKNHAQSAAEKQRERKYKYIDRKTEKKLDRIEKEKAEAMNGNVSKKLEKKLDKLERKQDKYKEKLAKQQKELQRGKKKEVYIRHNRNNSAFIVNFSKEKTRFPVSKNNTALIGGAVSAVLPVFIIVIIVILIAAFFSYLNPFKYVLAGTVEKKKAETEEEILGAYIDELKNYMDVAAAQYYLTYGNYCDAYYSWEVGIPSWEEYYKKFVEPEVNAKTEEIQEKYRESFAAAGKAGNYSELSRLGEAMSKEISAVVTEIIEKAREAYQEIVDKLNDMYGDPEELGFIEFFDAVKISGTAHTRTGGGYDENYDVGQYNGRTCNGTNGFDLKSLKLETDLSAEDLFTFIALSRALNVMNGKTGDEEETETGTVTTAPSSESGTETGETGSSTESKKKKNDVFAEITTDEINKFFEKTEFVTIEAVTHKGTCDGNCRRKLIGDWDSGFSWKYYCLDEDDPEDEPRHNVLTGKITLKTKDEMIDTIMEVYNAKDAKLTKKDCEKLCKEYMKEIEKKLGNEKHYFGGNNSPLAVSIYNLHLQGKGVENEGMWNVPTPIKGEENEEEEESDEKTAEETAA